MRWFQKKSGSEKAGRGLVTFAGVEDALKAEKIVRSAGYSCALVAPPPSLRKGCDLALEFNLVEQPVIERLLNPEVPYVGIYPLKGTAGLLQIVKVTHFPGHTMVKAGNMKITFDKSSGVIVNTSGGGCPDIPYLHARLVGCKITEAPRPRDIGFTLCALMLDRALEECLSLWKGGEPDCC
ncbi:MAG: Uncharacterized protein XD63_0563 [Thermoanaerobacterales bacterium 50_218]|nr:MAG: Uncharacterized protein XD63_0563 [Thermoanaerobacterales bacterium 50_218]HAA89117.1 hypothetical protein [Peptococcaceae bacterium]